MTPTEFKAWFDGFTEAMSGCPTKAQWSRIKERVAEIDGKVITERVFLDRYWPTYYPLYTAPHHPSWTYLSGISNNTQSMGIGDTSYGTVSNMTFSSLGAMDALGRNELQALS